MTTSSTKSPGQLGFPDRELLDSSRRFATLRDELLCQSYATGALSQPSPSLAFEVQDSITASRLGITIRTGPTALAKVGPTPPR